MRISSGFAKGMELRSPRGLATRPTSAKVRAAIINALQNELEGAVILDLFSGTGSLGIEAASRGAASVTFVEQTREGAQCLRENIAELERRASKQGLQAGSLYVHACTVTQYLAKAEAVQVLDLVFADPPYAEAPAWLETLLEALPAMMKDGGLFVYEADRSIATKVDTLLSATSSWALRRSKNYGDTSVYTFCYNQAAT